MYLKITQTLLQTLISKAWPQGSLVRLAANVIAIWQKSQRKCSETSFHKLYMVGLEVACVVFGRICTYTDTLLLGSLQKRDVQSNGFAIWCVSNKKVMTVLHKQVICFNCASVCVCVCGHNIISPSLSVVDFPWVRVRKDSGENVIFSQKFSRKEIDTSIKNEVVWTNVPADAGIRLYIGRNSTWTGQSQKQTQNLRAMRPLCIHCTD